MRSLGSIPFLVLIVIGLVIPLPGRSQSLFVGEEVVYGGGPTQPSQSVKTGTSVNFDVRGGGTLGVGAGGPASRSGTGEANTGTSARYNGRTSGSGSTGASDGLGYYRGSTDPSRTGQQRTPYPGSGRAPREPAQEQEPSGPPPLAIKSFTGRPVPDLLSLLADQDPGNRVSAARALRELKSPEERETAARALEAGLGDSDPRVLREFIAQLGTVGDLTSAAVLRPYLFNFDDETTLAVIRSLRSLRDPDAIPDLQSLAERDTGLVGTAAAKAVDEITAALKKKSEAKKSP